MTEQEKNERKQRITEIFKNLFGMEPFHFYIHRDYLKDRIEERFEAYRCFQVFNVQFELSIIEMYNFDKLFERNCFLKEDLSYRKFGMRMFCIRFYIEDYRVEIWIGIFPFVKK